MPPQEGEIRILDNGVAEGIRAEPGKLVTAAMATGATELVMPDIMNDCDNTLEMSARFAELISRIAPNFNVTTSLAGVVQGRTFAEWLKCVAAYANAAVFQNVRTLMFPRCMNQAEHQFGDRVAFLRGLFASSMWKDVQKERHFNVHCLGASPWVREVTMLASFKEIRSMDTCLPIALGLEGLDIRKDVYVRRQDGYFDLTKIPNYFLEVIDDNCRIFRDWADDKTASVGQV